MSVETEQPFHISSFVVRCLPEKLQQIMAAVDGQVGMFPTDPSRGDAAICLLEKMLEGR